jgi:hypothetical protein
VNQHRTACALLRATLTSALAIAAIVPAPLSLLSCNNGAAGGAEPTARAAARGGKALVEQKCSPCHDLGRIQVQHADAKGWAAIVDDMERRGLSVNAAERKQIVDYLATQ